MLRPPRARGARGRASPGSPGRGSAPPWRRRRCRSASSTRRASATTRRSSPRRSRRWRRCSPAGSGWRWASGEAIERARHRRRVAAQGRCATPGCASASTSSGALLAGEEVSHDGLVTVDRARLWTLPESRPRSSAPRSPRRPPRGTRSGPTGWSPSTSRSTTLREVIDAYRDAGGRGTLPSADARQLGTRPDDEALAIAHDQWRSNVFAPPLCWDLETVEAFDAWQRARDAGDVAESVRVSADLGQHAAWLQEYVELGFDELYLHHVGQEQAALHRRVRRAGAAAARRPTAPRRPRPPRPGRRREEPAREVTETGDLWWKNAVFYCADVETFYDWNGDGTATSRHDRAHRLPRRPRRDLPVADALLPDRRAATTATTSPTSSASTRGWAPTATSSSSCAPPRDRGIRVIVDFVMNHTSRPAPLVQVGPSQQGRPLPRLLRVVRRPSPGRPRTRSSSPTRRTASGSVDERTGEWYLHHFYKHAARPQRRESRWCRKRSPRSSGFWLQLGVSGFRVDAVPFLFARGRRARRTPERVRPAPATSATCAPSSRRRVGDGVLLGEVNLPLRGAGAVLRRRRRRRLNMQFDFIGMQRIYLSLARGDAGPLAEALRQRPRSTWTSQWANFVRNHDELTLDKLSDDERQEVFDAFGPEPSMQLYGRGLRRRLPPMLGGDQRRMRMVYSPDVLAARHPGALLRRGDRHGREPRHRRGGSPCARRCSGPVAPNGGFSTAPAEQARAPAARRALLPRARQRADQRRDPDSLWATCAT